MPACRWKRVAFSGYDDNNWLLHLIKKAKEKGSTGPFPKSRPGQRMRRDVMHAWRGEVNDWVHYSLEVTAVRGLRYKPTLMCAEFLFYLLLPTVSSSSVDEPRGHRYFRVSTNRS